MAKPRKAIILLSGGLDSTVAAFMLRPAVEPALAITVDYGQKAAMRELLAARALARHLDIPHRTIPLPFLKEAARGALTDPSLAPPQPELADLDDRMAKAAASAAAVWVPNRNGALIAVAATLAERLGCGYVVCGFNREEAATFPDNSQAFITATNGALCFSTRNQVQLLCPTITMDKTAIVQAGARLQVPFALCWPCYLGGKRPCGRCESCLRFRRAFQQAGLPLQEFFESGRVKEP